MGASITSKGRKKNLSSLLHYVANPHDKGKCVAVSSINCSEEVEICLNEMNRVRTKMNSSKDVTQAYHLVHSFDKKLSKELSIDEMHKIAVEFANKSFPNHQIMIASHNDKEHFHSHIVVNNIDLETSKRIRIDPKDILKMQSTNDEILLKNNIEPIDKEKYSNIKRKENLYSRDPMKLKSGKINFQSYIQDAVDTVLNNKEVTTFDKFTDELAKNYHIEVYKFSKNSNKLGYVLYKDDVNYYENRQKYSEMGESKEGRKNRKEFVERTFSAKKLGTDYELENISMCINQNLNANYHNKLKEKYDNRELNEFQRKVFETGYDDSSGQLYEPIVELTESSYRVFDTRNKKKIISYDDLLDRVADNYMSISVPDYDLEYDLNIHTHVNCKTLDSKKMKNIKVKKSFEKEYIIPGRGYQTLPSTPTAKELHLKISRVLNDDINMYRAKKDFEYTQELIEREQSQRSDFEM